MRVYHGLGRSALAKASKTTSSSPTVGRVRRDTTDSRPMDTKGAPWTNCAESRKPGQRGRRGAEAASPPAWPRLDKDASDAVPRQGGGLSGGKTLRDLGARHCKALTIDAAKTCRPPRQHSAPAGRNKSFSAPALREAIKMKQRADLVIDVVTQDTLLHAAVSEGGDRATALVQSFETVHHPAQRRNHRPANLVQPPTRAPLKFEDVKALADALHAPPLNIDEAPCGRPTPRCAKTRSRRHAAPPAPPTWSAWCALPCSRPTNWCPTLSACRPTSKPGWPSTSRQTTQFNTEQQHWLEMIRDHIAANLGIEIDDFEYAPSTPEAAWARCTSSLARNCPR